MSFSFTALQRIERLAPDVEIVQLVEHAQYWPMLRRAIGKDWIVGPGIAELREHHKLGRRITKAGHDIHVWTVNTAEDLQLCLDLGVKAVITDRPAFILELLDQQ
jgi:glycerophosphoryl diester phosphodiesterase